MFDGVNEKATGECEGYGECEAGDYIIQETS